MDNQNRPEQNKQDRQKRNFVRNIIIFTIAIICIVAIFYLWSSSPKGKETTIDVFKSELYADHIERVELTNKRINYKTKDGDWYWYYNRSAVEYDTLETVNAYNQENSGVEGITQVKIYSGTNSTFNALNLLYPILLLVVIVVTIVMISRMIRNANSRGMDFVKNRARVAVSKVKFDRVAGADEEKAELEEIIQFLKDPQKFTKIGARIPKGVLLVGPPGTGKTLLAKAVAGEANVPFFTISGSDFMELYVGVGASRVRDLFENAKMAKPCIIFIDEIDAVGRQRGTGLGGGNDEREQTLNQLLVQMDGFDTNEGIIVMAATNRADILDPALTRPGRFDRQIYINPPDINGRAEILRVHSEGKPLSSDVDLKEVARITSGFTGADLENVMNEAAILAARQNHKKISMSNINEAIDKVSLGPQKRSRVVSERDKKITAFHESGHAVVGKVCQNGDNINEVSIIQRGGAAGFTSQRPDDDNRHITRQKLFDRLTMLVAGRASEETFLDDITTGASGDIQSATSLARKMVTEWGMSDEIGLVNLGESNELFLGRDYQTRTNYSEDKASKIDAEVKKLIMQCYARAKDILSKHKKQVQTMVDVLIEKETIYADEVELIMNGATKEEVVEFIDKRHEKKEQEEKQMREQEEKENAEADKAASDFVSNLLKEAELRKSQGQNVNVSHETEANAEPKPAEEKPAEVKAEQPATQPAKRKYTKRSTTSAKPEAKADGQKTTARKPRQTKTTQDKPDKDGK